MNHLGLFSALSEKLGNWRIGDSVDARYSSNHICIELDRSLCNIGWTEPLESLRYNFYVSDDDDFDISVRVAASS